MIGCKFRSKMYEKKCLKKYPYEECPYENETWNSCDKLKGEKINVF